MSVYTQQIWAPLPLGRHTSIQDLSSTWNTFDKESYAKQPSSTLFEYPPASTTRFKVLLPIMSRLPVTEEESGQTVSKILENPTQEYLFSELNAHLQGTLPYDPANEGLTYTISHLPVIDEASRAIWTALHSLRPQTDNYAEIDVTSTQTLLQSEEGPSTSQCPFQYSNKKSASAALTLIRTLFNWSSLRLPTHISSTFYGVVFRSTRAHGSESTNLYMADKLAHEEAVRSGGLLMYFYGTPDPATGVNLATCIWSSRADARKASALPMHRLAVEHAKKAYGWFELERYAVVKRRGEQGVRIEPWVDDSG